MSSISSPAGIKRGLPASASGSPTQEPPFVQAERPTGYTALGYGAQKPSAPGEPVEAYVRVGDQRVRLDPNEMGQFQRIDIPVKGEVEITLVYPHAREGDWVRAVSLDSGTVNGGDHLASMRVGPNGQVRFRFNSSSDEGLFRISLTKGFTESVLEFWAGQPEEYLMPRTAASPFSSLIKKSP